MNLLRKKSLLFELDQENKKLINQATRKLDGIPRIFQAKELGLDELIEEHIPNGYQNAFREFIHQSHSEEFLSPFLNPNGWVKINKEIDFQDRQYWIIEYPNTTNALFVYQQLFQKNTTTLYCFKDRSIHLPLMLAKDFRIKTKAVKNSEALISQQSKVFYRVIRHGICRLLKGEKTVHQLVPWKNEQGKEWIVGLDSKISKKGGLNFLRSEAQFYYPSPKEVSGIQKIALDAKGKVLLSLGEQLLPVISGKIPDFFEATKEEGGIKTITTVENKSCEVIWDPLWHDENHYGWIVTVKNFDEFEEAPPKELERLKLEQYKEIIDTLPESVYIVDANYRVLDFNKQAERNVWELYKREIKPGDFLTKFNVSPNNSGHHKLNIQACISKGQSFQTSTYANFPDGNRRYYYFTYIPLKTIDDEVFAIALVVKNLSDLKSLENELAAIEQRHEVLNKLSRFLSLCLDENGKIISVNQAFEQFMNYKESLIGKSPLELVAEKDLDYIAKQISDMMMDPDFEPEVECTVIKGDGSFGMVRAKGKNLLHDPKLKAMVIFVEDISERKKLELDLLNLQRDVKNELDRRNSFISTLSHEIRTPLNSIVGLAHLLMQENPRKEQVQHIKSLLSASENLLDLVNDTLDIAKIENQKLRLEKIPFEIASFLDSRMSAFAFRAEQKGVAFSLEVDPRLEEWYVGDPFRITQILNNLVSNAIKFTNKGKVRVAVELESRGNEKDRVLFKIEDSGIGIAAEKQEAIFERFSQAESETTRLFGGTGLGLAICKELLELMQSKIQLRSHPGMGSTFFFYLELSSCPAPRKVIEEKIKQTPEKYEYSLLLGEDHEVNAMLTRKFIETWGMKMDIGLDGEEVIGLYHKKPYDLILLDLHMPKISGFELCSQIKSLNNEVKVVALTASSKNEVAERCRKVGFDEIITKPYQPSLLQKTILNLLKKEKSKGVQKPSTGLDFSGVMEIAKNDNRFLEEYIRLNIKAFEELMIGYKEAFIEKDKDRISRLVHKIKPTIHTLKMTALNILLEKGKSMLNHSFINDENEKKHLGAFEKSCREAIHALEDQKAKLKK